MTQDPRNSDSGSGLAPISRRALARTEGLALRALNELEGLAQRDVDLATQGCDAEGWIEWLGSIEADQWRLVSLEKKLKLSLDPGQVSRCASCALAGGVAQAALSVVHNAFVSSEKYGMTTTLARELVISLGSQAIPPLTSAIGLITDLPARPEMNQKEHAEWLRREPVLSASTGLFALDCLTHLDLDAAVPHMIRLISSSDDFYHAVGCTMWQGIRVAADRAHVHEAQEDLLNKTDGGLGSSIRARLPEAEQFEILGRRATGSRHRIVSEDARRLIQVTLLQVLGERRQAGRPCDMLLRADPNLILGTMQTNN